MSPWARLLKLDPNSTVSELCALERVTESPWEKQQRCLPGLWANHTRVTCSDRARHMARVSKRLKPLVPITPALMFMKRHLAKVR